MSQVRYECGCTILWHAGPVPRKCPAHWLQERVVAGDKNLARTLKTLRPRREFRRQA